MIDSLCHDHGGCDAVVADLVDDVVLGDEAGTQERGGRGRELELAARGADTASGPVALALLGHGAAGGGGLSGNGGREGDASVRVRGWRKGKEKGTGGRRRGGRGTVTIVCLGPWKKYQAHEAHARERIIQRGKKGGAVKKLIGATCVFCKTARRGIKRAFGVEKRSRPRTANR